MYVCQRYKFYIWHATDIQINRYTNTCTHICRDTSTYRYRHIHTDIHKHTCRHTQTYMHIFYIHKHTYIYVMSILPPHFISSCHLPNELRSPWTYFCVKCMHSVCSVPWFTFSNVWMKTILSSKCYVTMSGIY